MKQIDRIKNMTTSEMAEYLDNAHGDGVRVCRFCVANSYCKINFDSEKSCKKTINDYLESEVET